jgi:hypothetical protein
MIRYQKVNRLVMNTLTQTLDFIVWNKDRVWGIQWERYANNMDFFMLLRLQIITINGLI